METGSARVYGASSADAPIHSTNFLSPLRIIMRLLSWIFAIVVVGYITVVGYINPRDPEVKWDQMEILFPYVVGLGVVAFLDCVGFLLLDAHLTQISNARPIFIMDFISAVLSVLWFLCFYDLMCLWELTTNLEPLPVGLVWVTIVFSFFSFCTWAVLAVLAYLRNLGIVDEFT